MLARCPHNMNVGRKPDARNKEGSKSMLQSEGNNLAGREELVVAAIVIAVLMASLMLL